MTVYETTQQMITQLAQFQNVLTKLSAHADQKKMDPKFYLNARLIADQFHFTKQIQIATDVAKAVATKLAKKEAPVFEDNEQTIDDLKKRLQKTIDLLKASKDGDFEGYESVKVPIHFRPGKYLTGKDYFQEMAVPNFFFHLTTAYAILRANGVDLGKADFLGDMKYKDL